MRLSEIKAVSLAEAHQKERLTPPESLQRGHRIQAGGKKLLFSLQTSRSCNQGLGGFRLLRFLWVQNSLADEELDTHKISVFVLQEIMDFFFCRSGTGVIKININYFSMLYCRRSTNEQPQCLFALSCPPKQRAVLHPIVMHPLINWI